jgi:hypothetical protein
VSYDQPVRFHPLDRARRLVCLAAVVGVVAVSVVGGSEAPAYISGSKDPAYAAGTRDSADARAASRDRDDEIVESRGAGSDLGSLIAGIRAKAGALEASQGMRQGFAAFTSAQRVAPDRVRYADYVLVRLLYEATRDAGFWNLRWTITNREPNSDHIWRQWRDARAPDVAVPTASAECDELSALYAFLAARAGVRRVGLFWPYANHTVAVWTVGPTGSSETRVVVPTSQVFLGPADTLGTRRFDPWTQKAIYDYSRRDVPDTFEIPAPLAAFFLAQLDKYGGASDRALQELRYLRESVFLKQRSREDAAREALRRRDQLRSALPEDLAAFAHFAADLR